MRPNRDEIAGTLPKTLTIEAYQEAFALCKKTLGGNVLLFSRVSYSPDDGGPQFWDDPTPRAKWATLCRCSACGNVFQLGYASGKSNCKISPGVIIPEGPDGTLYSGVADDDEYSVTVREGETGQCPDCGAEITVRRAAYFKRPKTYRCLYANVVNVERYATVMFWTLSRTLDSCAGVKSTVTPFRAVVIADRKLLHFRWRDGSWASASPVDPSNVAYISADGGTTTHMKIGALISRNVPNLSGTTGEKSGLAEYIANAVDGGFPVSYLRNWTQFPAVENLVKSGWARIVDSAIRNDICDYPNARRLSVSVTLENMCDWRQTSPAKMLSMTRAEVRIHAADKTLDFNGAKTLSLWHSLACLRVFVPGQVQLYLDYVKRYGHNALSRFKELIKDGVAVDVQKLDRYLTKQYAKHSLPHSVAMELFCDYRRGLAQIAPGPLPLIEQFPPNLKAAHDRVAAQAAAKQAEIAAQAFVDVRDKWAALEYSDGAICTRLPLSKDDLLHEGRTLNHCVGMYGPDHLSGKLIVFIRHARRPERPWFTLNVDTRGKSPKELQLHGYGNDFAKGKPLHIPKAVRTFCDKWETEVLLPVFREVNASGAATKA